MRDPRVGFGVVPLAGVVARERLGRQTLAAAGAAVVTALAILAWPGHARGIEAREILDRARELNRTTRRWTDRHQRLGLRIVDRRGGTRERDIELFQKKYDGDRSKAVLFFHAPPEVKGTGFLQWLDPHGHSLQWLFLPELKRVRQISGSTQRESFMGTDFSYEDLAINNEIVDWSESDAAVSLDGDDQCDGMPCWRLAFVPREKEVAYATIRVWMDAEYRLRRFEFRDGSGAVVKELVASDIRAVGSVPTPFRLDMRNTRAGSRTEVELREIEYDRGLDDGMFNERRLEKGI